MNDAVAQRERRRDKPVPVGRGRGVLADRQGQLGEHRRLEILDIPIGQRRVGADRRRCFSAKSSRAIFVGIQSKPCRF